MFGILSSRSPLPFEKRFLEKKRQREGSEFEEQPKRQKVKDEDEYEYEDYSKDYSDEDDGYEDYSENEGRFDAGVGGQYFFHLPTNDAVDELCKSFYYDDTLPPDQVRARIQAFLNILSEETMADEAFVRVSKVMMMCLEILIDIDEIRLTRRVLFLKLVRVSPNHFSSQLQVNRTIQDVVALLRCSSYSLGIEEQERGEVAGRILIQEPDEPAVDCFAYKHDRRYEISNDLKLLESLVMETDACCIIVVEKHVIFERMALDHAFNQRIQSILLTSRGYPNTATRFLLHRMTQAFPRLPILALFDWKPATLAALSAYKFGSKGVGLEAYGHGTFLQLRQYAPEADGCACNVKWLGLRWDDLQQTSDLFLSPLNGRDRKIAESLIASKILQENDRKELEVMMEKGRKAEIEVMCYHGMNNFLKYIANKIEQALSKLD